MMSFGRLGSYSLLMRSSAISSTRCSSLSRMLSTDANASSNFEFAVPFEIHRLPDNGPKTSADATREELMGYFRTMSMIRRMEMAAADLYKSKFVRGFCHLYSGQEAVAVAIEAAIERDDSIITSYRAHGFTYTRGASVREVLAELTGRATGVSKGKGGSMHMYAHQFYGGNGIVGAQVPLGAGIGFAHLYKGNNNCCVALYGDGAANQGQIFEAYNMSKLWNVPVVFVCENNKYGMGTSIARSSASTSYFARGDFLPGIQANGMDVLTMREAMRYAVDFVKSGKGPILVEAVTYRYGGHSMSDPGTSYRTREEIKKVRSESDPITGLREKMIRAELGTADEFKAIEKEIREEVDAAVALAKADPELPIEKAYTDIYADPQPEYVRGCDPFTWGKSV